MEQLKTELKQLIISSLELEDIQPADIDDAAPLFIDGLGLDSIDALELGLAIKKKYNIKIDANDKNTQSHFASINNLAAFVQKQSVVEKLRMTTKQDILAMLTDLLVDEFELDSSLINMDAQLYQDLDLDSIDAVDLVVKLREITGTKIEPEAFKQVRTVGNVVDEIYKLKHA